jgi:NAD(P)-dependent dehydrogenase (short-subunit alcohol dehydrogenase family)
MRSQNPVALITGCSSGIGAATARRLAADGYRVYATARDVASLKSLDGLGGVERLALDVTDSDSAKLAVAAVAAAHGRIDLLVNNAGTMTVGSAEDMPVDRVREQFEVNFFGLVRLTQLVLPWMRERGSGTVVNISTIFGRIAIPGTAAYAASKHAVEAYSEALRLEAAPFGIRVALIEPGPVKTRFGTDVIAALAAAPHDPAYARFHADLLGWYRGVYQGPKKNIGGVFAVGPDAVADAVARAARARRPRARYRVGFLARMLLTLRRQAPQPVFEAFVRQQFPVPKV